MPHENIAVATLRKIREQHQHQLNDEIIKEIDEVIDAYNNSNTLIENAEFASKILEVMIKAVFFIERISNLITGS